MKPKAKATKSTPARKAKPTAKRTAKDIGQALGVSRQTVHGWVEKGCPHQKRRGHYYFDAAAVRAWKAERDKAANNGATNPVNQARAQKEQAQAKLIELKLGREQHKLIDAAAEEKRDLAKLSMFRDALSSLPGQLAARCAGLQAAEIQQLLDDAIRDLLTGFAQGLVPG